ncbi:hypothetical protein, partial [Methylibium rhizosphaerae]|uniref:hypothetical protein n=1 Tax=Methylibium rhizosphaerae TaxID=2570323 RepID=UPI001C613AA2
RTLGVIGGVVEHWECRACRALTSTHLNQCWNCHSIKGELPPVEIDACANAGAHERGMNSPSRVSSLAVAQVLLFVSISIALSVVVKPIYCFVAYSNGCPYKLPELKLVFLAIAPFMVVAVDVVLIFLVAPGRVPPEVVEAFVHHNRPKFLRRWYSKLVARSYSRS